MNPAANNYLIRMANLQQARAVIATMDNPWYEVEAMYGSIDAEIKLMQDLAARALQPLSAAIRRNG